MPLPLAFDPVPTVRRSRNCEVLLGSSPSFSGRREGGGSSSTKTFANTSLYRRRSKFSDQNQAQGKHFDPNTSILTQYSHVTCRSPAYIDGARQYSNSSVSSLKSSDYYSTADESSDVWDDSAADLQDKGGKDASNGESDNESEPFVQTPKSLRKLIKKAKPPKLKTFRHGENAEPVIELFDWIIRPVPDLKGVCVEGQKKGIQDFWHSSAITEVKKRKFVKTASGTVYRLRGQMNKLCTIENGFSKTVADSFIDGFPPNWKKILEKFYSYLEHSISIDDECSKVRGLSLKKIGGMKPTKLSQVRGLSLKKIGGMKATKLSQVKIKMQKEEDAIANLDSILTPVGLVKRCNSANNFTVTRSGRMSLPPLARWQGQQYIYSTKTNTLSVGFQTAMGEKILLQETNHFMKAGMEFKRAMHHKSFHNCTLNSSTSGLSTTSDNKRKGKPTATKVKPTNKRKSLKKTYVKKEECKGEKKCMSAADSTSNTCLEDISMNDSVVSRKSKKRNQKSTSATSSDEMDTRLNPSVALVDCLQEDQRITRSEKKKRDVEEDSHTLKKCSDFKNMTNRLSLRKSLSHSDSQTINASAELNLTGPSSTSFNNTLNNSMTLRSKRQIPKCSSSSSIGEVFPSRRSKEHESESDSHTKREKKKAVPRSKIQAISLSSKGSGLKNKSVKRKSGKKGGNGGQRQKRKRESSFNEDTGYGTEEQSDFKLQQDSTPKSCGQRQDRKRRRLSLRTEIPPESEWSSSEKELFERALRIVDGNSPEFWDEVSEIVESRTESECREFHTAYLEMKTKKKDTKPAKSKPKITKNPSGRQKGDPVRGHKGTMKRKEEMREYLKEQNEDYEDNLFEGTPFMSRKLPISVITNIDFDKDDSEIFGSNHNFITPMTKNTTIRTPGTRLWAQLASVKKTPTNQSNHSVNDTPVAVVRQIADKYIHTFKNQQKKNSFEDSGQGSKIGMENMKQLDAGKLPLKSLFSPSIVVYDQDSRIEEEDEHGEESNPFIYYWNEDEN